ncbi:hypothetical protein DENIT_180011 [Pseudomonas veronii]|nr:hypothetical protein DENIT_180011 [Pseudomonas veronii]
MILAVKLPVVWFMATPLEHDWSTHAICFERGRKLSNLTGLKTTVLITINNRPTGAGAPGGVYENCVSFANMKFYLGSVQPFLGKMPTLLV